MLFLGITSAVVVGMLVAGPTSVDTSQAAARGGGRPAPAGGPESGAVPPL